jgi:hypothetical protein
LAYPGGILFVGGGKVGKSLLVANRIEKEIG